MSPLLTHAPEVDYISYVEKIKTDPIARKVKLVDLKHNTDASRNKNIRPPKYDLYLEEINILEND